MTSRDGAIWVACVNGVARVKDGKYQHWSQQDGLADYHCRWVMEDEDGVVWAGLATGISRLQDGKIRNFRREDGLLDGNIQAIMSDGRGYFWIDSGRGIYRVSRKELNNYVPGESRPIESVPFNGPEAVRFSEKYGQEQSAARTSDGQIWFPVAAGAIAVNPTQLAENPVAPPIYIRNVRGHHEELDVAVPAVLRPGENRLEFQYGGLSFIAPQKIQYAYQLIGHDVDWVDAGNRRSATYANLKPGQYEFLVKARNVDGVWSRVPASFRFEILPHYFQTAWFKGSMGLLTVLALSGIYGWRMRVVRGREKQSRQARELLEATVHERTAELLRSNTFLTTEIEERKRMEAEVERIHRQLLDVSRQAGQAEVASSVLHNVGNVLNSVNVSTSVISERLRSLRLENFQRAVQLFEEHRTNLGGFLTDDSKGRMLPDYLGKLATHLVAERTALLKEVQDLSENVDHIKGIVAMQQNYARVRGVTETIAVQELVDSAIKMHAAAYARHAVTLVQDYEAAPEVTVDKHKVLQILVNILHNAKYACDDSGRSDKRVEVRIRREFERVRVEICDNGIGIAPEHMARLFSHGFTTRAKGHGFGLHSAALAAKDLGGSLSAQSAGVGQGATFILEIPLRPPATDNAENPGITKTTEMALDRAECDPARCNSPA
jgi:signal transduction histidine kinase